LNELNMTFIGAGNMASAIISGLVKKGVKPEQITAAEPSQDKLDTLSAKLGVKTELDNLKAVKNADVIVLSVKPQVLQSVCEQLKGHLAHQPLIISIAAGLEMSTIERWLDEQISLVRCMPNTPAQTLEGASGLVANAHVSPEQKMIAQNIFSAIGVSQWVEDESLLHAVTALSGSGPAYIFLVIDAMAKAGVDLGIEAHSAKLLAAQTALGAAKMVLESELAPEQLKRNVMSPGGTTERAVEVLEARGVAGIFAEAMTAADKRSGCCSRRTSAAAIPTTKSAGWLNSVALSFSSDPWKHSSARS